MSYPPDKYGSPYDKKGRIIGITLTILLHLTLMFVFISTEIRPNIPIPQETKIILEFIEEKPEPIKARAGTQPRSEKAKPKKELKLVQKSKAPLVAKKENKGVETTVDKQGDVEVPEPPRPKPINRRALFTSARNKQDSLAPQTADKASFQIKAGHPQGNTKTGIVEGTPTVRLKGRSMVGTLPHPEYAVENAGRVVVRIIVDQYGKVINAYPGAKGTTVQNAILWKAARRAALKAKFNRSSNAPPIQEGTITYIFTLK